MSTLLDENTAENVDGGSTPPGLREGDTSAYWGSTLLG